jgi:hypothetical protein
MIDSNLIPIDHIQKSSDNYIQEIDEEPSCDPNRGYYSLGLKEKDFIDIYSKIEGIKREKINRARF